MGSLLTLVTIWDKPYRNITERYDNHEYDIWHVVGYAFCELQLTHALVKHDFKKNIPPNFLPPNFSPENFRNHDACYVNQELECLRPYDQYGGVSAESGFSISCTYYSIYFAQR